MSADNLPHCPDCGYTEQDASIHMDHYRCEARGGAIPRIRWQDYVELQRRMDAVREWAESMPDAYPESLLAADEEHGARIYARGMCTAAHMVLALLDGEAGDE